MNLVKILILPISVILTITILLIPSPAEDKKILNNNKIEIENINKSDDDDKIVQSNFAENIPTPQIVEGENKKEIEEEWVEKKVDNCRDYNKVTVLNNPSFPVVKKKPTISNIKVDTIPNIPDQITGFSGASIANNATNIPTTQHFSVEFEEIPTDILIKQLKFFPATDFEYNIEGNLLNIYPKRLDRLTQYTFGKISKEMCLAEINENCEEYFQYAITFTSSFKETIVYGKSVEDRDLTAHLYGKSDENGKKIMLTGGIHGEEWTSGGLWMLVDYLDSHPAEFTNNNKSLIIITRINVDGARLNRRENSNGVNLNRNWPAYWEWAYNRGDYPLSEPEAAFLYDFTLKQMPDYLISYHSQWPPYGIIFLGNNDSQSSRSFAQYIHNKTGYPIGIFYGGDHVEGDQTEWTETVGITSAIIEATYKTATDWNKNFPLYLDLIRNF